MKDFAKGVMYISIFLIPFIPLYVESDWFFPFITGKNFAFRILVEIAFASWILLALYDTKYRPRFSWIMAGITVLIVVMAFANALGEYPLKSFWSNFERMDGYVTLVHFFLYTLVIGSVLSLRQLDLFGWKTSTWNLYFGTILIGALFVAFQAAKQIAGIEDINQGGWRIDSTLGNASYMAVYMLFLSFISLLLMARSQVKNWKIGYGVLSLLFISLLFLTVTRGTAIGLVFGLLISGFYIAIFEHTYPKLKKMAIIFLIGISILAGSFIAFRDTTLIQENRITQRLASITSADMQVRFTIWGMAFEGFKERPILGWGQGNFNYVFNQEYVPSLYSQETWFDRVHNLVFDWLIAGGILGTLAYFSIMFSALYYVFWKPLVKKDETFSVVESGLIIGLLAGYVVHNMVVFDNIVSYIFYGTILAFIHSRVSREISFVENIRISKDILSAVVSPVVIIVLLLVVYIVNVPNIRSASDVIDAFQVRTTDEMIGAFDRAIGRNSFANQEINEQLLQRVQSVLRNPDIDDKTKVELANHAEAEFLKLIEEKPNDARLHVFLGSYYRIIGKLDGSRIQLSKARELSPNKQAIIIEQGIVEFQAGEMIVARDFFKQAFDLAPKFSNARNFYIGSLFLTGDIKTAESLITDEFISSIVAEPFVLKAILDSKSYDTLIRLLNQLVVDRPEETKNRVDLANAYYISGDTKTAIDVLEKAIIDIPAFGNEGNEIISDYRGGRR